MASDAFKVQYNTAMLRALDVLAMLEGHDQLGKAELDADLEVEVLDLDALRARVAIVEARTALLHLEVAYRQLELLESLTRRTEAGTGRTLALDKSEPEGLYR